LIKKNSLETKTLIVKQLEKIIISDNSSDDYEANLMRRICGLIYFPDKLSGEVKMQIQKEKS
jgi:Tellurite resistance protein TerB.